MSNTNFVPQGIYENIINLLGQWKIMDSKSLYDFSDYKISYNSFLRKIRKLEETNFLKSTYIGNKTKHLYLSNKGIRLSSHDKGYEICDEQLTHDLITGIVLRNLLEMDSFVAGTMFNHHNTSSINPDARVVGVKDGQQFKIAIEIELTPKESSRVKSKFKKYAKTVDYEYCFYITNKAGLFRSYSKFLQEMTKEVQEGIILIYDKSLSTSLSKIEYSSCLYLGKETSFTSLFNTEGCK